MGLLTCSHLSAIKRRLRDGKCTVWRYRRDVRDLLDYVESQRELFDGHFAALRQELIEEQANTEWNRKERKNA